MPSTKDLFTFFLKAEDLKGRSHLVTIESVGVISVFNPRAKRNEDRLAVRFFKAKLTMLINKTQAISLERITGTDDYSLWLGHQITLSPATTANGAGTIVISAAPKTEKPAASAPAAQAAAAQETAQETAQEEGQEEGQEDADDDPDDADSIHLDPVGADLWA